MPFRHFRPIPYTANALNTKIAAESFSDAQSARFEPETFHTNPLALLSELP